MCSNNGVECQIQKKTKIENGVIELRKTNRESRKEMRNSEIIFKYRQNRQKKIKALNMSLAFFNAN
jgi:hypothetical protein